MNDEIIRIDEDDVLFVIKKPPPYWSKVRGDGEIKPNSTASIFRKADGDLRIGRIVLMVVAIIFIIMLIKWFI